MTPQARRKLQFAAPFIATAGCTIGWFLGLLIPGITRDFLLHDSPNAAFWFIALTYCAILGYYHVTRHLDARRRLLVAMSCPFIAVGLFLCGPALLQIRAVGYPDGLVDLLRLFAVAAGVFLMSAWYVIFPMVTITYEAMSWTRRFATGNGEEDRLDAA